MTTQSSSRVVGATLVGGVVGAGLALLFAPRSGRESRQQIQENLDNFKQTARDKFGRAKDTLADRAEDLKETTDEVMEAAHQTGRKAKNDMKELQSNIKSRKQSPVLTAWEEEV